MLNKIISLLIMTGLLMTAGCNNSKQSTENKKGTGAAKLYSVKSGIIQMSSNLLPDAK